MHLNSKFYTWLKYPYLLLLISYLRYWNLAIQCVIAWIKLKGSFRVQRNNLKRSFKFDSCYRILNGQISWNINSNKQSKEFSSALKWTLWYRTWFNWSFCGACTMYIVHRTKVAGQNQDTSMKIFISHRILYARRYIFDISGKVFCHYNSKVKKEGPSPVMKTPTYIKKKFRF